MEYECEESPDPAKISKAMDTMTEIDERINELESVQASQGGQSQLIVDRNLDKDIRDRVSRIPEFDAKSEVSIFLRECGTVYDTLVKDQNSQVEVEFVRKLNVAFINPIWPR